MDNEQLKSLLIQEESATLEFKREPYWIDHKDSKVKSKQRDELTKDILALANGNSIVAGERAFLVIGADNKKDKDGFRPIFDIGSNVLTTRRILDIVNNACSPKLEDLEAEIIELDGKQLNVITINPSPHLYETTRRLEPSTAKGAFTEYVVFVRHNESVRVASGKERDAIAKLKRLRFDETRNPHPAPFGAIIGAIIGAMTLAAATEKVLDKKEGARTAGAVAGALFGGSIGFMMGNMYRDINEIRSDWYKTTPIGRYITLLFGSVYSVIVWFVFRFFSKKKKPN